jgi:hypothetical protein
MWTLRRLKLLGHGRPQRQFVKYKDSWIRQLLLVVYPLFRHLIGSIDQVDKEGCDIPIGQVMPAGL